jgi:acetate kinase
MKILVVNSGSSSFKYSLFDMETEEVLARGLADRIGTDKAVLQHAPAGGEPVVVEGRMRSSTEAIGLMLAALMDGRVSVIKSLGEIGAVGHRVGHGGEKFACSVVVDGEVMAALAEYTPLAPLHQPAFIRGIEAFREAMPGVPQVAAFDTAFHQTMPPKAYLYGLPYELCEKLHIRRFAFHGSSHRYVSERAIARLGKPASETKIVTCHLGSGGSVAAVCGGKSVDSSMGMTPLEGILMGTRCGDIDPAAIEYLMVQHGMTIAQAMDALQKKSGLLGLSGVSADMRDVLEAARAGNARAKDAVGVYCYRVRKYIGAYAAAMGGLDALVFTAGIGERSPEIRKGCVEGLGCFGVAVDDGKNEAARGEAEITAAGARARTFVIPTDEELVIARDTLRLVAEENRGKAL